jgi:hypothetical protein
MIVDLKSMSSEELEGLIAEIKSELNSRVSNFRVINDSAAADNEKVYSYRKVLPTGITRRADYKYIIDMNDEKAIAFFNKFKEANNWFLE